MATAQPLKKLVIIGVGLIGGSFALTLKKHALVKQIVGVGRSASGNASSLERALNLGIIDAISTQLADALDSADLVLIAVPVAQTEAVFRAIYPHLQPHTIVTDAGSTKNDVVAAARRALAEKIAQFVPAHPIAGRELHGPEAALSDLYQGKKIVITALPENSPAVVQWLANVWQQCGAVPHYLTPAEHDRIFASVSHLPHVLAYAMVNHIAEQPDADVRFHYAASGFRDFTRIAGSSPEMWRDISLANRALLLEELAHYQTQLQRISIALQQADAEQLFTLFTQAQTARQGWLATEQLLNNDEV